MGSGRAAGSRGFSLVECTLVLGIVGILTAVGVSGLNMGAMDLAITQQELQGSMDQAFTLARAKGENVVVTLGSPTAANHLPVHLPRRVKWGKPAHIPLPPGMDDPVRADTTGEAHPRITVTPRRTATASAWFLNAGGEALCMRLSNHGHIRMLRWKKAQKRWVRV